MEHLTVEWVYLDGMGF
ncbi:hypothetical protein LINPERPRIM_LOCUS25937 [Linum perenne]